ncbi:MAG: HAD-IB family phosphatase [Candidatus Ratteibacteria bacterium]
MCKKNEYLAIAIDIDGTIVKPVSSWRYIHEKLGNWDTLACRYQEMFLAGKITYSQFCKLDAAHWKGISEKKIADLFKDIPYTDNAKESLLRLKKMGFQLIALSTGLQYIQKKLQNEIGFRIVVSNKLLSRNGILTGGVKINISHGEKGKVLRKILKKLDIPPEKVICIGDSDGDVPMAETCGFSIAFNSSSQKLNKVVDVVCKGNDFMEVLKVIERLIAK